MIQKLLAFAGGEKSARQTIDVRETLTEIAEILRHALPQTIDLQVKVPPSLGWIEADRTELSQVVMNLAINARDAMPLGGRLEIEVRDFQVDAARAARSDDLSCGPHILITVTDTGEGIPNAIIDRIFDPFLTTKAQGKGTGLGLATTMGIVRSYGGEITVYSELGCGSKFSILLPSLKSTAQGTIERSSQLKSDTPTGTGETILVVDDEAITLETTRETLESSHYIKHSLLESTGPVIVPSYLPDFVRNPSRPAVCNSQNDPGSMAVATGIDFASLTRERLAAGSDDIHREMIGLAEKEVFGEVLKQTGGNLTQAAKRLGITRTTLRSRLEALGISLEKTILHS